MKYIVIYDYVQELGQPKFPRETKWTNKIKKQIWNFAKEIVNNLHW